MHELLDPVQRRLAPLAVELGRLLRKSPSMSGIGAVDVGAAGDHEGLEPRGRVAEGAAAPEARFLNFLSV